MGAHQLFMGRRDGRHPEHSTRGGEQGDPLMPMLLALGQHPALLAVQAKLLVNERVFAYLGDMYAVCRPDRCGAVFAILQQELQSHAEIQLHHRMARRVKPEAVVWRGDLELLLSQQCMRVLGVPIGQPQFVRDYLERKNQEHEILYQRILWLNDPQAAWLLLLMCASTRANFWLRAVRPDLTDTLQSTTMTTCGFACAQYWGHQQLQIWRGVPLGGRIGVGQRTTFQGGAHWASWADCIRMAEGTAPHHRGDDDHPHGGRDGPMFRGSAGVRTVIGDSRP